MKNVNVLEKMKSVTHSDVSKSEELLISKFETFVNQTLEQNATQDNQFLQTLGLGTNIVKTSEILGRQKYLSKFGEIYSETEIKRICGKYGLRILHAAYYKGEIPLDLASKIKEFEKEYDFQVYKENFYILAPPESFNLKPKQTDPIAFVKIHDNGYYKMIKKWGNDLSWYRYLTAPITSTQSFGVIMILYCVLNVIIYLLFNYDKDFGFTDLTLFNHISSLPFIITTICAFSLAYIIGRNALRIMYNSEFEN